MLPFATNKIYNPCAVCVNKHIAQTTGDNSMKTSREGPGPGCNAGERGHIKVEFGGMVCYTLREY